MLVDVWKWGTTICYTPMKISTTGSQIWDGTELLTADWYPVGLVASLRQRKRWQKAAVICNIWIYIYMYIYIYIYNYIHICIYIYIRIYIYIYVYIWLNNIEYGVDTVEGKKTWKNEKNWTNWEKKDLAIILRWLCCQASSSEPSSCNHSPTRWFLNDVLSDLSMHCISASASTKSAKFGMPCTRIAFELIQAGGIGMSKIRHQWGILLACQKSVPCLPCLWVSEQSL